MLSPAFFLTADPAVPGRGLEQLVHPHSTTNLHKKMAVCPSTHSTRSIPRNTYPYQLHLLLSGFRASEIFIMNFSFPPLSSFGQCSHIPLSRFENFKSPNFILVRAKENNPSKMGRIIFIIAHPKRQSSSPYLSASVRRWSIAHCSYSS